MLVKAQGKTASWDRHRRRPYHHQLLLPSFLLAFLQLARYEERRGECNRFSVRFPIRYSTLYIYLTSAVNKWEVV